jgi:2'-5' RNA ligase
VRLATPADVPAEIVLRNLVSLASLQQVRPLAERGTMAHAVEVFFDSTTEAAIKTVWARLEAAGVPSLATRTHRRHRPHISLSVAERIKTGQLHDARERLAAAHLDVTLYSPAIFPRRGVLYLSVVPTLALLRLHEDVHVALHDSLVAPWDLYSVGAWVPHCTLAQELSRAQIAQGIDLLHDQPTIAAHVSSAGILDTATGEVLPLAVLRSHR